ncbi:lipase/acyltransferase domain-containing protein [Brevibacillus sp. NRS-1366]|uniref:lipase/acyltransferase domain-containing protein n=1 Tax=Brevibacillus sp. NRS-1366 TaxID=3233899 RepID=UPI003D1E8FF0
MDTYLQEKVPIVFVPGLFGSMSNQIIPGTGNWNFGFARIAYEPFIRILEQMGYRRGEQLFIAFYDWRQPIAYCAEQYLIPTIEWAKQITGSSRVNLICHSMGGLVSRAYVQGDNYKWDVDQLLMMATPNAGSPVSYCYWAGGKLPRTVSPKKNVVELYMNVYLAYLERRLPRDKVEAVQKHFPSLLDLVPGEAYGDYLLEKRNGIEAFVPYSSMVVQNQFLDHLNSRMEVIWERNIEVTLIAGIGQQTIQYLQTVPSVSPKRWVDGRPISAVNSNVGDGNVMATSVLAMIGEKYVVQATHLDILYKSEAIIRYKLQA